MKENENLYRNAFNNYFEHASRQSKFYPTHLTILMALVHYCNHQKPLLPFNVSRKKLMRFSKIKSISTYHKNIRELRDSGFIKYTPSWHPKLGSEVRLNIELEKNF